MITKEILEKLYLEDHLTYAEIGRRLGVSRQYVGQKINKLSIDTARGESFFVNCDTCGKAYIVFRGSYKNSVKHYCSKECYVADPKKHFTPRKRITPLVTTKCDKCGKVYELTKAKHNKSIKHYCTTLCYYQSKNQNYKPSRWGQMKARKAMSKILGRKLTFQEVVHHKDTDCGNNSPDNLILFYNQSDHMKHHHSSRTNKP